MRLPVLFTQVLPRLADSDVPISVVPITAQVQPRTASASVAYPSCHYIYLSRSFYHSIYRNCRCGPSDRWVWPPLSHELLYLMRVTAIFPFTSSAYCSFLPPLKTRFMYYGGCIGHMTSTPPCILGTSRGLGAQNSST